MSRRMQVDKAKGEADLSHGSAATAGPKDASQRILGTIVAVSGSHRTQITPHLSYLLRD